MYGVTIPEMGYSILGVLGCAVLVYIGSWLRECHANEDYTEINV